MHFTALQWHTDTHSHLNWNISLLVPYQTLTDILSEIVVNITTYYIAGTEPVMTNVVSELHTQVLFTRYVSVISLLLLWCIIWLWCKPCTNKWSTLPCVFGILSCNSSALCPSSLHISTLSFCLLLSLGDSCWEMQSDSPVFSFFFCVSTGHTAAGAYVFAHPQTHIRWCLIEARPADYEWRGRGCFDSVRLRSN